MAVEEDEFSFTTHNSSLFRDDQKSLFCQEMFAVKKFVTKNTMQGKKSLCKDYINI